MNKKFDFVFGNKETERKAERLFKQWYYLLKKWERIINIKWFKSLESFYKIEIENKYKRENVNITFNKNGFTAEFTKFGKTDAVIHYEHLNSKSKEELKKMIKKEDKEKINVLSKFMFWKSINKLSKEELLEIVNEVITNKLSSDYNLQDEMFFEKLIEKEEINTLEMEDDFDLRIENLIEASNQYIKNKKEEYLVRDDEWIITNIIGIKGKIKTDIRDMIEWLDLNNIGRIKIEIDNKQNIRITTRYYGSYKRITTSYYNLAYFNKEDLLKIIDEDLEKIYYEEDIEQTSFDLFERDYEYLTIRQLKELIIELINQ